MLNPSQLVIDEIGPDQEEAARGPFADDGRKVLRECLESIMKQVTSWHEFWKDREPKDRRDAPHNAVKVTTGVGKSEQLRQTMARFVIEAKSRKLPHRVLVALPTHRLADEARSKMPNGVTTAIWQGRGGTMLGSDEPMCRNPEAVEAALKIGAEVQNNACKRKEARCPFYDDCAYQKQKKRTRQANVVFCAHEVLFQTVKALGKNFGLVVVDESFWQDGITGSRLAIAGLHHELEAFPVRDHFGTKLENETTHLRDLIERLQSALDEAPDGYVQRAPLIEAGLLPRTPYEEGSCAAASKLEWKRKVDAGLLPGATPEQLKDAVKKFGFIGQLPRRAAMWRALDDLLASSHDAAGRLRIETSTTENGTVRWLRVIGHKDIVETLARQPLIHADATLPLELVQHYLPNLRLACDLDVAAPHMRVTQVIGLPVGKASLQPLPAGKRSAAQEARVGRKRQRLVDAVRHLVQGRRGLVITYKDIENDFAGIEGTEVAHFGAIEGIDRWNNVDILVIIGRPLPRPRDIERMAAAITGQPVIAGDMIQQERQIRLGHVLQCRVYAEREAEMIRQAVPEAAVAQAIGRVRGVNRTASNPVEVFVVLSDVVVPEQRIDEVVKFDDIEPDAVDKMVARGLVPQFGSDAAKLYPDLFPSAAAARKAFQRAQLNVERGTRRRRVNNSSDASVTSPYREISIRRSHTVRVARYRPAARYQQTRLGQIDVVKIPNARSLLEAALGVLALFEILTEPQGLA